jgi:hypothetical protein
VPARLPVPAQGTSAKQRDCGVLPLMAMRPF